MRQLRRTVLHANTAADWLPRSQRLVVERRLHPRALLSLPVRLRWLGTLGLESEPSETLDVGRGGLLVSSREPRVEGSFVWITFPFDSAAFFVEPETSAQVARSKTTPSGGCIAGIAFGNGSGHPRQAGDSDVSPNGNTGDRPPVRNRRRHVRTSLALPIRIRGADASWPDDAMTMDISKTGLLFCTLRVYEVGDLVALELPRTVWDSGGGRRVRIARMAVHPAERRLLCVGVEYIL